MSISETLKKRLAKDRSVTSVSVRIPADVVESMNDIALKRGMSGYQALLKLYLSEGLRRDEVVFASSAHDQTQTDAG